jgi:hypothetical protein
MQWLVPRRFRRPAVAKRLSDRALGAGLAIYLCMWSAIVGCFALGLYELLQPARYPNPGVSGYKPPTTGILAAPAPIPVSIEPEVTARADAGQPPTVKKSERATTTAAAKRTRPARPRERDPRMDYAAQPAFGSYRPWGSYPAWGTPPNPARTRFNASATEGARLRMPAYSGTAYQAQQPPRR